jgi:MFS family permease
VIGLGQLDVAAPEESLRSPALWACAAVLVASALALWFVERRAADPVLPPALVLVPQLRLVGVIALAVGTAEAGLVFLPDMAVLNFGIDAATASLTMLPLVLTLAVGAPIAGWLLDRHGPRVVVQSGLALTLVGLAALGLAPLDWANFYLAGALVGLGLSALLGAPLRYIALQEAGEERRGAGQALLTLCVSIGQLVGAAGVGGIVGSATQALGGYRQSLLAVAGVCAIALLLSAALRGRVAQGGDVRAAG